MQAHHPGLAPIDRQLRAFTDALRVVSRHWSDARPATLWWDDDRRVLATDEAAGTYRAVYGPLAIRGLRRAGEFLRRRQRGSRFNGCREPVRPDVPLPPDAVIKPQLTRDPQGSHHVLTIVSQREQCVAKIFASERKAHYENELKAWRVALEAGFAHRVPQIISSGETEEGFSYLVSRLVPHNGFFYPPGMGDWLWRRHLVRQVLPELQRFYDRSGVEVLSGAQWHDRLRALVTDHPMSVPLQEFLAHVERAQPRAADDRIPFARVHGDLVPPNVHRSGRQWWLIDWSYSRHLPVTFDLWRGLWRHLQNDGFGSWLRGTSDLTDVPSGPRAHLDMYAEWLATWRGLRLDAAALRFQVLATLLHRLARNQWTGQMSLSVETFRILGIRP